MTPAMGHAGPYYLSGQCWNACRLRPHRGPFLPLSFANVPIIYPANAGTHGLTSHSSPGKARDKVLVRVSLCDIIRGWYSFSVHAVLVRTPVSSVIAVRRGLKDQLVSETRCGPVLVRMTLLFFLPVTHACVSRWV